MAEIENHTLAYLRRLEEKMDAGFARIDKRFDDLETSMSGRMERAEKGLVFRKKAEAGMMVQLRGVAAEGEIRLKQLEARVERIENEIGLTGR